MNILFLTIAWPAKGGRNLYTDLMFEFYKNGHNVYVIAANGSNNTTELDQENGLVVLRVKTGQIRKSAYFRKAFNLLFLGNVMYRAISRNFGNRNFDLFISSTPPITLSGLFKKLKRKFNTPFYLLLKDIWPQGSVDLKVIRKYSIIWFFLRLHEIKTYRVADYIGTMSQMNKEYLLLNNSYLSDIKVEVCPNSIIPSEPLEDWNSNVIRKKYGIPLDACVFVFSGNLGKGHGLEFIIEAVRELQNYSKAFFIIGGSGTHIKTIKNAFASYIHKNVLVYEWLPQDDFENILITSDVGLILLDNKFTIPQFPSRLLSYLNHGMPVLCAVNDSTDISNIVEESYCGKAVIHGDMDSFIRAIKFFAENLEIRSIMGNNARELLLQKYTVDISYNIIMSHFKIDSSSHK